MESACSTSLSLNGNNCSERSDSEINPSNGKIKIEEKSPSLINTTCKKKIFGCIK